MNIERAVEILQSIIDYVEPLDPPEEHDALKLGIQALERVRTDRTLPYPVISDPLPGETTDRPLEPSNQLSLPE